ncbi:Ribosomal protein L49/IMG2, partial [Trinorchestia longiramus]
TKAIIASSNWFDAEAKTCPATKHIDQNPTIEYEFPAKNASVDRLVAEWAYVERLFPKTAIKKPNLEPGTHTPGGYIAPSANPGDHPYFVGRTYNFMPRVHFKKIYATNSFRTVVSGVEGDIFQLAADLKAYLINLYGLDQIIILQVLEPHQKIFFEGDFVNDIKEFLLEKGF